jgi:hypothetical protein
VRPTRTPSTQHAMQTNPIPADPAVLERSIDPAPYARSALTASGLCRHRADCSDHHCPGRLAANLSGTDKP